MGTSSQKLVKTRELCELQLEADRSFCWRDLCIVEERRNGIHCVLDLQRVLQPSVSLGFMGLKSKDQKQIRRAITESIIINVDSTLVAQLNSVDYLPYIAFCQSYFESARLEPDKITFLFCRLDYELAA